VDKKDRFINRRSVLKSAIGIGALASEAAWPAWWSAAQHIATHTVNPRTFGAKGDGVTRDTEALQKAIESCASAGGGTVLVSPGTYLSGTLELRSNITLEVQAGATILGSPDANDYFVPPDAPPIVRALPGRHLLYALGADNLTLRGPGVIDGHSSVFLGKGQPPPPPEDLWKGVYSAETVRIVRISPMVELANCNNLLIENITLQNAVGWTLRPSGCKKVIIRGVKVRNPLNASNADGIDPTACEDALITDCDVITGDDAICLKGNNQYGGSTLSRNVTVSNCRVSTCCNGLKVGEEGGGDFENIVIKDCEVYSGDVPFNHRVISGIEVALSSANRIDGISFSNITMKNVRTPIYIRLQGRMSHEYSPAKGSVSNVHITGVRATGAILTSSITGQPGAPVQQISLSDVQITTEEPGRDEWVGLSIPEKTNAYDEANMMGRFPSYGIYARHVKGLQLSNVSVKSTNGDPRPMLVCDDVQALTVNGVSGTPSGPGHAFLDLRNVQTAVVRDNTAPAGSKIYARISGNETHNIRFMNNDLHQASQPIETAPDVPQGAVIQAG
jgi:polygalacturonase